MKVRIQNDGGPGYQTKFTSVETGQELQYISQADIHLEASSDLPTARLIQLYPVVDVIVEAEIEHVCPCCGQPTKPEEKTE